MTTGPEQLVDARQWLDEYALGMLDDDERRRVQAALAADPQLAAELRAIEEDLAGWAACTDVPRQPPPSLRRRMLTALQHHGRLEGFAEQVAGLIDASVQRARYLLRLVDDDGAWVPVFAGCDALHIRPGPAVAPADVGLLRFVPGGGFPHHKHLGNEQVLVLQGRLFDELRGEFGPGALIEHGPGSEHALGVVGDQTLVLLVVAGGVSVEGVTFEEPAEEFIH